MIADIREYLGRLWGAVTLGLTVGGTRPRWALAAGRRRCSKRTSIIHPCHSWSLRWSGDASRGADRRPRLDGGARTGEVAPPSRRSAGATWSQQAAVWPAPRLTLGGAW